MPEAAEGGHGLHNLRHCSHSIVTMFRIHVAYMEIDTCFLARFGNEINWWTMGPGKHFSVGGHFWAVYWRVDIWCEYLDHATTAKIDGMFWVRESFTASSCI